MGDINLVMSKLEDQDKKLDKIELAITQMAVQGNQIVNLSSQVSVLFKKNDDFWGPQGVMAEIQREISYIKLNQTTVNAKQENCQVKTLSTQVKGIWAALLAMALAVIAKSLDAG